MREETRYVIFSELSQKQLLDILLSLKYGGDELVNRGADVALRNYVTMLRKCGDVHMKEVNMAVADLLDAGEKQ